MLNNLDTTITSISEDQMESLFGEAPEGTPKADDLVGQKKEEPVKKVKEDEVVAVETSKSLGDGIEKVTDLDALLEDEAPEAKKKTKKKETDEDEDEEEVKKVVPKKKEEKTDDEEDEQVDGDKKKKTPKKKEESAEPSEEEVEAVNGVLKSTVDYLVDKGIWLDFEGRDELEVDQKTYAELAAKQDEARVSTMFNELIDSTGPYGKAIIGFVKQGGDPEAVIDIFKEQKQIENFDTKGEDGQKALISKYYQEVLNWKPGRVEKHISSLIAENELETETTEIKELYDKHHQKELTQIAEEQRAYADQQKRQESEFKQTITSAIKKRTDLTERDKQFIEKSVLSYNNKLPDGTLVSNFYVRFAEIQSNPEEYIDLVRFAMDKENYIKNLKTQINNKVADETFNFVKGNTALSKKKGSAYDKVNREESNIVDFDFGISRK